MAVCLLIDANALDKRKNELQQRQLPSGAVTG
jgi:hypothetical protein